MRNTLITKILIGLMALIVLCTSSCCVIDAFDDGDDFIPVGEHNEGGGGA